MDEQDNNEEVDCHNNQEKKKNLKSLVSAGILGAGFYAGHKEGQGKQLKRSAAFLTKYAPAAFTLTGGLVLPRIADKTVGFIEKMFDKAIDSGDLEVILDDGSSKKFYELSPEKQKEVSESVEEYKKCLREQIVPGNYVSKSMVKGAITGATTLFGYLAGRFYSNIKKP